MLSQPNKCLHRLSWKTKSRRNIGKLYGQPTARNQARNREAAAGQLKSIPISPEYNGTQTGRFFEEPLFDWLLFDSTGKFLDQKVAKAKKLCYY